MMLFIQGFDDSQLKQDFFGYQSFLFTNLNPFVPIVYSQLDKLLYTKDTDEFMTDTTEVERLLSYDEEDDSLLNVTGEAKNIIYKTILNLITYLESQEIEYIRAFLDQITRGLELWARNYFKDFNKRPQEESIQKAVEGMSSGYLIYILGESINYIRQNDTLQYAHILEKEYSEIIAILNMGSYQAEIDEILYAIESLSAQQGLDNQRFDDADQTLNDPDDMKDKLNTYSDLVSKVFLYFFHDVLENKGRNYENIFMSLWKVHRVYNCLQKLDEFYDS